MTHKPGLYVETSYNCNNRRNAPIINFFFAFSVFPLIVARVSNQNPDLNDVQPEEEDIITIFQFEHYFMDYCRSVPLTHLYHSDKIWYQTSL